MRVGTVGTAQIIQGSEMDRTSISTFLTGGSLTHLEIEGLFYLRSGARAEISCFGDSGFFSNFPSVLVISCFVPKSFKWFL
jgi:hypothetical protein